MGGNQSTASNSKEGAARLLATPRDEKERTYTHTLCIYSLWRAIAVEDPHVVVVFLYWHTSAIFHGEC